MKRSRRRRSPERAHTIYVMTRDYSVFSPGENRDLDLKAHRDLLASMREYGFLKSQPIMVRKVRGKWVVIDGQHRLAALDKAVGSRHFLEACMAARRIDEFHRNRATGGTVIAPRKNTEVSLRWRCHCATASLHVLGETVCPPVRNP